MSQTTTPVAPSRLGKESYDMKDLQVRIELEIRKLELDRSDPGEFERVDWINGRISGLEWILQQTRSAPPRAQKGSPS